MTREKLILRHPKYLNCMNICFTQSRKICTIRWSFLVGKCPDSDRTWCSIGNRRYSEVYTTKVNADEAQRALIEVTIPAERINDATHTATAEKETSPFICASDPRDEV